MTDHPGRSDVARRRHVDRLRAELELKSVPPYVGSELRTLTPLVREQLQLRLLDAEPPSALSPGAQERLLSALVAAAEEFAHIVEDRPLNDPPAEALLVEIVRDEGAGPSLVALDEALDAVSEVLREQWQQQPHSRSHTTRLGVALDRYVARLRATLHSPLRDLPDRGRAEETRPEQLLAEVERRWGGTPAQLCLMVGGPGAQGGRTRAGASRRVTTAKWRYTPRPLRLAAADHVLVITEHSAPAPRAAQAVRVGPVPAGEVAAAYDIALLMFRLVAAGVAAAPASPELLRPPHLGFLRALPTEAAVAQIAKLLRPLTQQTSHRRLTLARTLQQRLRAGGPIQSIADHLGLHAQSARNHLCELRRLFDTRDLDFGRDTLTMQAALDLVLPLWELESAARQAAARDRDARGRPAPPPLPTIENQST